MSDTSATSISFVAPSTLIDPSFWEELYERKLNIYKLGTEQEDLSVYFNCSDNKNDEPFVLEQLSFPQKKGTLGGRLSALGTLVNVNTIEVSCSMNDCL
jgi:hypothetical protein